MFLKALENSPGSFVVKGEIVLSVNAHVIHVDLKPFLCNHICTYVIHECLRCRGCIGESEEHNSRLI